MGGGTERDPAPRGPPCKPWHTRLPTLPLHVRLRMHVHRAMPRAHKCFSAEAARLRPAQLAWKYRRRPCAAVGAEGVSRILALLLEWMRLEGAQGTPGLRPFVQASQEAQPQGQSFRSPTGSTFLTVYVKKHPCPPQQPTGYRNSSVSWFSLKPRKAKLPFQVAGFLWAYLDTLSNVSALLASLIAGCALGTPSPGAYTTLTASDPNNGTTALDGLGADNTPRLTDEGVHCHRPPPPGFPGWPP